MPDPLSVLERRLLGVLVEKALTSAAPEPLSLNAVIVGSNQKSNRDPLISLEEPEADDGLEKLQRKGLVYKITGGRVERWRHNLYDAWKVSKSELALLAELLLRGPQTAAEARSRASRMEPLDNDSASTAIARLVELGFIVWLTPADRRGATLTHGFHAPDELQRLKTGHSASYRPDEPAPAQTPAAAVTMPNSDKFAEALVEIAKLRQEVDHLQRAVRSLQEALGVTPG